MKHFFSFAVLIALVGSIAACSSISVQNPHMLELCKELNLSATQIANEWSEQELDTFSQYTRSADQQSLDWDLLYTPGDYQSVEYEAAVEDVETLFKILKNTYSGYDYFGGDVVFNEAKQKILDELSAQYPTHSGEVTSLSIIICDVLKEIVVDGHLYVNGLLFPKSERFKMYYVPALYIDDPIMVEASHQNIVKKTILPSGELGYMLASLSIDGTDLPLEVQINGTDHILSWVLAEDHQSDTSLYYSTNTISQIPIITIRSFQNKNNRVRYQLDRFVASGSHYSKFPFFIIDLRGHEGGNDGYGSSWIANYIGKDFFYKVMHADRNGSPLRYMYESMNLTAPLSEDPWLYQIKSKQEYANNNIIVILVDHNTTSAGESFVHMLKTLPNTIIVGSNTMGSQTFGNLLRVYLPNSHISLHVPIGITFYNSVENYDLRGIQPDLWVPPEFALDRTVSLALRNQL